MNSVTPLERFFHWEKKTPEATFLRQPINGVWHSMTYREAAVHVKRLASALTSLVPPHSHVAILSKNCAHWILTDLAIMLSHNVSVPLYPTLSAHGIDDILRHSECTVIFLGKLDNFALQRPGIPDNLIRISFPDYGPGEGLLWHDLLAKHEAIDRPFPEATERATIMYSSGTTGKPKGVMLTHGAFGFVGKNVSINLKFATQERFFSYLPLSHIAERGLMEMAALHTGGCVSFTESLDLFQSNLQHEKPTVFGGVPRIYAKFQEGILKKLPEKRLNWLLSIPIISRLVKKKIRQKLGLAHAHLIVSGAAPSPVSQLEWFSRLGIDIAEIYGMTENIAFSHANFRKIKQGTVGEAWPECTFKLGEDGEILVKHEALMTGYFKDEETTRSVFTEDGYFRTGDKGTVDEEGFLTITGRVKDQFKTDKGKYIAPAPIELTILSNTDIEQVCVVGMGLPQPVGLVILSEIARQKSRPEIIRSLEQTLDRLNPSLEAYERLQKIVVMKEAWSVENGFLTPSLKLKRTELEMRYVPQFKQWYDHRERIVWEGE